MVSHGGESLEDVRFSDQHLVETLPLVHVDSDVNTVKEINCDSLQWCTGHLYKHHSYLMVFVNVPIPPISTSTTSPSFKNVGGVINNPTPPGVPVMINEPRCRV